MKNRWMGGMILAALLAGTGAFAAETMSVQIRTAQLRAEPSFLGKPVGQVEYATQVTVSRSQGDWRSVTTPSGTSGWLHQSALTPKKLVMKAGQQNVQTGASGEELALAGKGFNSDIEADFKKKNGNIDFTWIDRMEKFRVSASDMTAFLEDGQVRPVQ